MQTKETILAALRTLPGLVAEVRAEGFMLPLGARQRQRFAVDRTRAALDARVRAREPGAADELVVHLLAVGPETELAHLDASILGVLGPRAWAMVAWARYLASPTLATLEVLRGAVHAARGFPLGEVLLAIAELHDLAREDAAIVEAFERLVSVDVHADPDPNPLRDALALFARARVFLALPLALDVRGRGLLELQRAIDCIVAAKNLVDPAFRARLLGNARLLLATHATAHGEEAALHTLVAAIGSDPCGPIGERARAAIDVTLARLRGGACGSLVA